MVECPICSYQGDKCPNMGYDGVHISCPICTGPMHPIYGCKVHPSATSPPRKDETSFHSEHEDVTAVEMKPKKDPFYGSFRSKKKGK